MVKQTDPQRTLGGTQGGKKHSTRPKLKVREHHSRVLHRATAAGKKHRACAVDLVCTQWGQGGARNWWAGLGLVIGDSQKSSWTTETTEEQPLAPITQVLEVNPRAGTHEALTVLCLGHYGQATAHLLGELGHMPYLGVGTDIASFTFSSSNFVYDDGNQPLLKGR